MATRNDICKKIEEIIPEAGKCGVDFDVQFDKENKAWTVDLHDQAQHLKTYIEEIDAASCVDSDRCIPLGVQVGQLKRNLRLYHES